MLCQNTKNLEISTGIFSLVLVWLGANAGSGSARVRNLLSIWGKPPERQIALPRGLAVGLNYPQNPLFGPDRDWETKKKSQ